LLIWNFRVRVMCCWLKQTAIFNDPHRSKLSYFQRLTQEWMLFSTSNVGASRSLVQWICCEVAVWIFLSLGVDETMQMESLETMRTQRICRAWGHLFARGFARVILNRVRDSLDQAPGSCNWGSELDAGAEFNFVYPPTAGRGRSKRPFLLKHPPLFRACYHINQVRSCGSRWNNTNYFLGFCFTRWSKIGHVLSGFLVDVAVRDVGVDADSPIRIKFVVIINFESLWYFK
jgi:hypothetical protein